ncbi:hypothetical protein ABH931_001065 [Streptacidiphilus sp. MAP12-33]|uniref:helix-turn-helix domain-containing protein n=1 Tax=Streptacidiphilus sp. MAP12-33 TaxID=3156266 RepID=UPI003518F5D0
MIVGDLLRLEDLRIEVAWATPELLDREVTGVTSTDLQDPARYLRQGELVLTGLVWWRPDDLATDPVAAAQAAGRFATALRSAEAAALLAGEGTHGTVPAELAEACRQHGIPLLTVPAGTSFRAVTDRVYLRLWGDLQHQAEGTAALPAAVRRDLLALLHADAEPSAILARAVTDLGLPHCTLHTTAGRLLGSSAAPALPRQATQAQRADASAPPARSARWGLAVGEPGGTPFDGWLLRPHAEPAPAAAAVLRGLAELLAPLAARERSTATAQRQGGTRIVDLLRAPTRGGAGGGGGPGHPGEADAGHELAEALRGCGLPEGAPLTPVVARGEAGPAAWAAAALAEALQETGAPFVVAPAPSAAEGGTATGLCAAPEAAVAAALRQAWPRLRAALATARAEADLTAATGPCVAPALAPLRAALAQADWTLASQARGGVCGSEGLGSLAALLRGVPAEVRDAYRERLLGPLLAHDRVNAVSLLHTLAVFLELDGSWSRAARTLHVHVNTVHYRVRRIEELTGRNLARLEDRADLRAALLCASG